MASVMIDVQFSRFVGPVSLAYSPAVTNQEPAPVLFFPFFFLFFVGVGRLFSLRTPSGMEIECVTVN